MRNGREVSCDGNVHWFLNDAFHRDGDLPAIEFASGAQSWYRYGKLYRYSYTDGSGAFDTGGDKWRCYKTEDEFQKLMRMKAFL